MPTVDADAHVIETPTTWSYMREDEQEFRPRIYDRNFGDGAPDTGRDLQFWIIDGEIKTKSNNVASNLPLESQYMENISRRLAHMDETGVDIQILYPTVFINPLTNDYQVELALIRSYNRWLADIWREGGGRLRWIALPPLLSMPNPALIKEELEFCKANGACGVFMRPIEYDRHLAHRYFFPLYEIAQDLDMAISLHAGNNSFDYYKMFKAGTPDLQSLFRIPMLAALHCIMEKEVPRRFPNLRWAFVEAGAQWLPYALHQVRLNLLRRGKRAPEDPLEEFKCYVTTQKTDDVHWILREVGDDHLLIGTDYGHKDVATEVEALKRLAEGGEIPVASARKILTDNPSRLHALA